MRNCTLLALSVALGFAAETLAQAVIPGEFTDPG